METTENVAQQKPQAPGARAWPLVGHPGVLRGLLPFIEKQWATYGDVFRVNLPGMSAVMLVHPEQVLRVLVSNRHNYVKGAMYDSTRKMLGDGVLTLEGEKWKERRALAQPAFHRASLEKLTAIMVDSGAKYFDGLAERVGAQGAELDASPEMIHLTLDVVINALFGQGTLDNSQISYQALGELLELLSDGINGVQLPAWVPTPKNRKFHRTMLAMDENVLTIIAAARSLDVDGTLLSMLTSARDEEGQPLTDKQMRDEVLTLFIAGHETTALTLTWMFAMLGAHPEILQRMRAEVDDVLGGREPTFADVPRLSYLRQVIDETLRLRPPAAMVGRNAVEDDVLGDFQIKAGDPVLVYIYGAHRHPSYWQEPEHFDPERFTQANSKGRHNGSYLPFSLGPRTCIGNSFALTEGVVLLAQMLNRFELEILPCADVQPVMIATVRPSKPIRVHFKPRIRS